MESSIEFDFARKLIEAAPDVLVTIPFGDLATLDRFKAEGLTPVVLEPPGASDLTALKRYLFATRQPPERDALGDVRLFSAPGEGRECVEIARRILDEARGGVPFDEMALFVRSPRDYVGLIGHAFSRAGIPAWFDRGTGRPHPSGRAFLALLGCAVERLSAARFAEYLSLSQVPDAHIGRDAAMRFRLPPTTCSPGSRASTRPRTNRTSRSWTTGRHALASAVQAIDQDQAAVVDGTLRAPWKWEKLIVESAVIGGDPQRWHRRLSGLAEQYPTAGRRAGA